MYNMLSCNKINCHNFSHSLYCNYMTNLPVLDNFLKNYQSFLMDIPLKNTVIVYIHHALQTSLNVISSLLMLGANPSNIYVVGKSYSENKEVVAKIKKMGINYQDSSSQKGYGKYKASFIYDIEQLWKKVQCGLTNNIQDVLILDHGGHAISNIPRSIKENYSIIGIEKTTAGTMKYNKDNKPNIPIINVAGCAAKRWLESPLIAEAIAKKSTDLIDSISEDKKCAVIGFGAIGQAMSSFLKCKGKQVLIYDKQYPFDSNKKLENIISEADYIFGCTGTDITAGIVENIMSSDMDKVFLSCSSEDKEFLSLLVSVTKDKLYKQEHLLDDIEYLTPNNSIITIMKGGFPVNFDSSGESVPAQDIQLTRTLVVAGVLQALKMKSTYKTLPSELYSLNSYIQKQIVDLWCQDKNNEESILSLFNSTIWISEQSVGLNVPLDINSVSEENKNEWDSLKTSDGKFNDHTYLIA